MKSLAVTLAVVSSLLIGAHFLRTGALFLVVPSVAVPLLLLTRNAIAVRVVQVFLVLAACEWLRTAYLIMVMRVAAGAPFNRMLLILGTVAALTFSSVFPLQRLVVRRHLPI